MKTNQKSKHTATPWSDASLWINISTGECKGCSMPHVLRNDLCWTCEKNEKHIQEITREILKFKNKRLKVKNIETDLQKEHNQYLLLKLK